MSIRPLHFQRNGSQAAGPNGRLPINWGTSAYFTHDFRWKIEKTSRGWGIEQTGFFLMPDPRHPHCLQAGLYEAKFERLRDAIDALETVTESSLEEQEAHK